MKNTSYPIKGWVKNSFCDWEGKISTVIFLPGCNFRCPFCQNWDLVTKPESFASLDWETIKESFSTERNFIDGVVITIKIIKSSGIDYEFRTTVLPVFHSLSKIKDIGKYLNRAKRYILQGYRDIGVNSGFKCDKIFSKEEMEVFKKEVEEFFDECKIRYYK